MTDTKTAVVAGSGIEGNITSCGIDTQPILVSRESIFSFEQTTTYRSYNVCTQEIVNEYQVPGITGFGVFELFVGVIVAVVLLVMGISATAGGY